MSEAAPHPAVPTVDLADCVSDDPARRAAAAEALRLGFGRYGLVYLRNHGIEAAVLDRFYDAFLGFTAMPEAEKQRYGRADLWYQRGWTPPNTEKAVAAGGQPDFKECYFACATPLDASLLPLYPQLCAKNVWPEGDEGRLETPFLALGLALQSIGEQLLWACERALSLPEDSLTRHLRGAAHVTRALRYLPLDEAQLGQGILWGEEHTDFNLLTILPGGRFLDPEGKPCGRPDARSGLYLRTRPTAEEPGGRLVPGTPPAGCIVAQVGQQLEILTGGTFLATPHVITAPEVPGYSRLSSAHFVHVHPDTVLFPLHAFRNPSTVDAYAPPVLASTYDVKTLVDIGLAPASALDRLGYRHYDRLTQMRSHLGV